MSVLVPPGLLLVAGAALLAVLPRAARAAVSVLLPLLVVAYSATFLPVGTTVSYPFMQFSLELVRADRLSLLFGGIFCITGALAALYASHEGDVRQQVAAMLYTAGAVGVSFAGDFLTLYFFWELLAIAGTVLVWSGGTRAATRAGKRYVLLHLAGGGLLLAGIALHVAHTGSIRFDAFDPAAPTLAAWLILAGFCLNAGVPPLHAWVPDAYPRATITGSVFLAAMTTKSAVYALLRGFAGWDVLVPFGVVMALYGVFFAVLASDLRVLLSYHIISQVGYMVVGAGIGTALAVDGSAAHAVNHLIYKGLLFMCAGAVIATTGRGSLADLGGLRSRQPLLLALYMIGALSISGAPLWNGFVSKGMLLKSAGDLHLDWTVLLLGLASVGTFISVGLKLPYFVWFHGKSGIEPKPVPPPMLAAMVCAAFLCTLLGLFPGLLYPFLPHPTDYDPFTATHLIEIVQLFVFAGFAFYILLPNLSAARKTLADVDFFYRAPARLVRVLLVGRVDAVFGAVQTAADRIAATLASALRDPTAWFAEGRRGGEDYDPDRSRPPLLSPLVVTIATFVGIAVALLAWQG